MQMLMTDLVLTGRTRLILKHLKNSENFLLNSTELSPIPAIVINIAIVRHYVGLTKQSQHFPDSFLKFTIFRRENVCFTQNLLQNPNEASILKEMNRKM